MHLLRTSEGWGAAAASFAIIIISFSAVRLSHSLPSEGKDGFQTKVHFHFNDGKKSSSAANQALRCHLTLDGSEVELNLVENDLLKSEVPVFLAEKDGSAKKFNSKESDVQKPKFFQDATGKAAVALWINDLSVHGYQSTRMDGVIFHGNETYRVLPIKNLSTSRSENIFDHKLTKLSRHSGTTDYVIENAVRREIENSKPDLGHRGRRTASSSYEVDLLFVLDYSTYQKFTADLSYNGTSVSSTTVLQQMRYYYSQVSNLVDLRYRGITTASYTIRTKLTALYIATRTSDSSWTETLSVSGGRNGWKGVNASAGLSSFTEWVYATPANAIVSSLPSFDHAVLFTSYDLYSESPTGPSYDLIGLAYLGKICTTLSTSIVENTGALTEASTSAHELGHGLGAEHDGDGNGCQAYDQYIMTAVSRVATNTTSQNYFQFSSCSIVYFTDTIAALPSSNCLTNSVAYYNATEWQASMDRIPGQVYSPNALCRQAYGESFEACGGVDFGKTVCLAIYCYNSSQPTSASVTCTTLGAGGRGLEGMSCGNNKWCQKGTCVSNSSAPAAQDDCPIGDYARNSLVYTNMPHVCSNMPSSYCYDTNVYSSCCATCNAKKNVTRPGCEYGDKTDCSSVTPASCPLNLQNCCRTCDAFISWPAVTTSTKASVSNSALNSSATVSTASTDSQGDKRSSSDMHTAWGYTILSISTLMALMSL